jgi:cyclic beta-1,2-glucan synthetase
MSSPHQTTIEPHPHSDSAGEVLRLEGIDRAASWGPAVKRLRQKRSAGLKREWRAAADSIRDAIDRLHESGSRSGIPAGDARLLLENSRLLRTVIRESAETVQSSLDLPHIEGNSHRFWPRAYVASAAYLAATNFKFDEAGFLSFLDGVQTGHNLEMGEIWALQPMLQFSLLIAIGQYVHEASEPEDRLSILIGALFAVREISWRRLFEKASVTERILRSDPLGAYPAMDFESRDLYRRAVVALATSARAEEAEVAGEAIALASQTWVRTLPDSRRANRLRHVGYYLIDEGVALLKSRLNCRVSWQKKLLDAIFAYPSTYYLIGVEVTTFVTVIFLLSGLNRMTPILAGLLLLLLPATQAAVDFINQITTMIAPPRRLPKLDYSLGIPAECATLVAVPTLLLNERQVIESVEDLEIRYLANRDPNLHFALVTDSPDSAKQLKDDDDLVLLCSRLIERLNEKYGAAGKGEFFLLHRRRHFNPGEDVWMGWERKRGKLLDLNDLLRSRSDCFPIKVGNLRLLPRIRYVITLDSDTQLPKDSAHKLIGAIAHPLNRAIVSPVTNTVVSGYGILQPRIGVSVHSAVRSRLASIYSGQTGFDIYTRAVSDVYQDLFGEGSFTGKGIYEVDTFIQVLAHRFPTNALLSHDLIEGLYARSALVSDIELIDDYPTHFRAYSKRKHRWVRGDWQIILWLFPRVPDFFGRMVENPISLISRWKILDNLRRSLIEIATLCLLLAGWFLLPGGPVYWTIATLLMLLIPVYAQLGFTLMRIRSLRNLSGALREAGSAFVTGHGSVLLFLIFLPYQALIMLDAIVRTLIRRTITRKKLLEWETAAQAEAATRKTPVDIYLDSTPFLAAAIVVALAFARPGALAAAGPILFLWFSAKLFSQWLNRPPRRENNALSEKDRQFLRHTALRTWRFFREYGGAGANFLIPDNVQQTPAAIAHRISPTNLGLLLNARLAAYDLGYLTLHEFVSETAATLRVMEQLPRYGGHFFNWYDTRTLQPLDPLFVSTVDSGNLAACLWTLKQACLELSSEGPIHAALWQGIRDHLEQIPGAGDLKSRIAGCGEDSSAWLKALPDIEAQAATIDSEAAWWISETRSRLEALRTAGENPPAAVALAELAAKAGELVEEMDFRLVYNPERKLLSVGYDMDQARLETSCYDLLASEARMANFVAVAKNDVPRESWFHLGRTHMLAEGQRILLSWTGTMFEYLLPSLWMKVYPNTILEQSVHAAVKCQTRYARRKKRPWGISEAAYAVTDPEGNYQYRAFGVPELALKEGVSGGIVAPYASALALIVDPRTAVENLRRMESKGWTGACGFYDSTDFTATGWPEVVPIWMSHHQGMILLSIANALTGCPMQRRFHAEPLVKANELILHEKVPFTIPVESAEPVEEDAACSWQPALAKGR